MGFSEIKDSYKIASYEGKLHHLKMISAIVKEKLSQEYLEKAFRKAVKNKS